MVGTCKHLGLDPFAYLCGALPAMFGLGEAPEQEVLFSWLPDIWWQRQE